MANETRIGLVGTGDIGHLHAQALVKRDDVELCVCRGVKAGGAERFAREYGARVYSTYTEMLSDRSIIAVDICVPNDLHRRYVEEAAAARKHILCEKPIATSLADAIAMFEAANQAGVLLMVAHPLRFWPEYIKMREIIQSRKLGSCLAITLRRMLSLLTSVHGEGTWRLGPERMGGAILDLQIHDLDFLNWTFGLPDRVYCAGVRSSDGGLNHTCAVFSYASGMVSMVESSYMLQGDPMIFTAKAICEHGTLDYAMDLEQFSMHALAGPVAGTTRRGTAGTLVCYQAGKTPEVLIHQEPNILSTVFAAEIDYFVNCAQGKIRNSVSPVEDAITALKLAVASRDSVLTGAVVSVR